MQQEKPKTIQKLISLGFCATLLFFLVSPCLALDVQIAWNASVNATGYRIYYDTNYMASAPPYTGTGANEGPSPINVGYRTQFTIHGLPEGGYRFALTAYNRYGESDFSAQAILPPQSSQRTLSINISGQGSVDPPGGKYNENASVKLTAIPYPGWVFSGWSGNLDDSRNPATIIMNGDKSVTANFMPLSNMYILSINTSGQGSVDPPGGAYSKDAVVQLTAIPEAGWVFSGWSGDLDDSRNPATIVMGANKTVTANFTQLSNPNAHTLSVIASGQGSVKPYGKNHNDNAVVQLTATPYPGWLFSSWGGDLVATNNPATIIMDADKSVTANFTQAFIGNILTVTTTGSGSVDPPGGNYSEHAVVVLRALPDPGWVFSGWGGDLTDTNNPTTIRTNTHKSVIANFIKIPNLHTLSVTSTGSGSVDPPPGRFSENAEVQLTATAASGWVFAGWSGDLNGSTNPATIIMNADKSVIANFMQLSTRYNLGINTTGPGHVDPPGGSYNKNATVQLTAHPAEGWEFVGWRGDLGGSSNPESIIMNSNKYVLAVFGRISPIIAVFAATPNPVDEGEFATLVWHISNATSASIDNGIGPVDPIQGSIDVLPLKSTPYTLTAANDEGSETAVVNVMVGSGIVEVIPHDGAGIQDDTRIAHNTSFAVHIVDMDGIDITNPDNIKFTIDDGTGIYERSLKDISVVTVTKLSNEVDTGVTELWAAYHRAAEAELGTYAYDTEIHIEIEVHGNRLDRMIQSSYEFKTETEAAHDEAVADAPATSPLFPSEIAIAGYDAGVKVTGGDLEGACIIYDSSGPVTPYFGPTDELTAPETGALLGVGVPMNLQPPTVFITPVRLFIPCPGQEDVSELMVFMYNGIEWVQACDAKGDVLPEGESWMVPGSRVNHNETAPPTIEIQVYHFSGAWGGR